MTKSKKCEYCKKEFLPPYRVTEGYWDNRKYCSNECKGKGSIGKIRSTKGKSRMSNDEKFWTKVKKGNDNECWQWIGAKEVAGYGFFCEQRTPLKWKKAHIYSYEIHKGEIKDNLCVCHSCDNKWCVNPNHLWLGTRADNNMDKEKKGRGGQLKGEKHQRAKITWDQRNEIIELVKSGKSQEKVGKMFGLHQSNISSIVLGKAWRNRS